MFVSSIFYSNLFAILLKSLCRFIRVSAFDCSTKLGIVTFQPIKLQGFLGIVNTKGHFTAFCVQIEQLLAVFGRYICKKMTI